MREMDRWYDRQHRQYAADRQTVEVYAEWLKLVPWNLFCTFTFAWRNVSDSQAAKVFDAFVDRLERSLECDVTYVRGDEKRFSGCGKPESPRHFHVLFACSAPLNPSVVEDLWMSMAGKGEDEAGALVEPYDARLNGVSYVLKFINQPDGGWAFRKLHLFHSSLNVDIVNRRQRRNVRRHEARMQSFGNVKSEGEFVESYRAVQSCALLESTHGVE